MGYNNITEDHIMVEKSDFFDDVNEGHWEYVRLYTKSGSVIGKIEKIREGNVKLLLNNGKNRVVSYDDITQYEGSSVQEFYSEDVSIDNSMSFQKDNSLAEADTPVVSTPHIPKILTQAASISLSLMTPNILKEQIKTALKEGTYTQNETNKIQGLIAKFENAIKIHDDNPNSDRMHDILANGKKLYQDSSESDVFLACFLGLMYQHNKEYERSISYFLAGKAYDYAVALADKIGNTEQIIRSAAEGVLYKPTLICLHKLQMLAPDSQWAIYEYALKNTDQYSLELSHCLIDFVAALLVTKGCFSIPDGEARYLNDQQYILLSAVRQNITDSTLLESIIAEKTKHQEEKEKKKVAQKKKEGKYIHFGKINNWNAEGKYGFIVTPELSQNIYFYINQVYDNSLREILVKNLGTGIEVKFTLGRNIYGKTDYNDRPAANHIELVNPVDTTDVVSTGNRFQGTIIRYNRFEEYGKISDESKLYTFQRRNIIDIDLISYLFQSGAEDMDWPVEFSAIEKNNKLQVVDIVSLRSFANSDFSYKEAHITDDEKDKWANYKKNDSELDLEIKENVVIYDTDYIDLPPYDETLLENLNAEQTNSPAGKIFSQSEANVATAAEPDVLASIKRNVLPKDAPRYYMHGHQYMLTKQTTLAKENFIKAIEANDTISSAVSDLLSIYILDGKSSGNYQDAFSLMKNYGNCLTYEKRLNQWITLYAASKADDETLIKHYREAIDYTTDLARKVHFTKCIAELQLKHGQYHETLGSCDEWKQYAQKSDRPLSGDHNYIKKLCCLAFYGLKQYDKSRNLAEEIESVYPNDETLKKIITGRTDVVLSNSDNKTQTEDVVSSFERLPDFLKNKVEDASIESLLNTKFVKDTQISNNPTIDQVHTEYEHILRKSRSMSDIETAKWAFGVTKYVLTCLRFRPGIHGESLNNKQLTEADMLKQLDRAIRSLIRGQIGGWNPSLETVRYLCRLRIKITVQQNLLAAVPSIQDTIDKISDAYFATYFEPNETLKSIFATDNSMHIPLLRIMYRKRKEFDFEEFCYGLKNFLYELRGIPSDFTEKTIDHILSWLRLMKSNLFDNDDPLGRSADEIINSNDKITEEIDCIIDKFQKDKEKSEKIPDQKENFRSKSYIKGLTDILDNMFVCKTDRSFNNQFHEILKNVSRINDDKSFVSRTQKLANITSEVANLQEKIEAAPTEYSYNKLQPILGRLKQWSEKEYQQYFTEAYIPEIFIELTSVQTANDRIAVVWKITNSSGRQIADNPRLKLDVGNQFKNPKPLSLTPISSKPQEIQLELNPEKTYSVDTIASFDWHIEIEYQYQIYDNAKDELTDKTGKKEVSQSSSLVNQSFKEIPNPFESLTHSGPVPTSRMDMIFGRKKEIQEIINKLKENDYQLASNRSLALYGQKRSGKTTLLNCVKKEIGRQFPHVICIDLGSMGSLQTDDDQTFISSLEGEILSKLSSIVTKDEELTNLLRQENASLDFGHIEQMLQSSTHSLLFNHYMKTFEKCLKRVRPKAQIVLFLDEFTYLYTYIHEQNLTHNVLQYWKAFMQTYNCSCVIVGQDNMEQLQNDYPNEMGTFKLQRIHYLEKPDTQDMLFKPLQATAIGRHVEIEDGAYEELYNYSAGSAYWHIILCSCLVNYLNRHLIYKVTPQLVRNMVEEELESGDNINMALFEPLYNDYQNKNQENINVMLAIARACTVASPAVSISDLFVKNTNEIDVPNLIKKLVHRKVLEEKIGQYRIIVGLFKEYLIYKNGRE